MKDLVEAGILERLDQQVRDGRFHQGVKLDDVGPVVVALELGKKALADLQRALEPGQASRVDL